VSRTQRSTFAAIGIAIVAVAVALMAGGGESPGRAQGAGAPALVTVVGGEPDGGVKVLGYRKGDRVRLTVQSDRADVVHVHGYDLRVPVRMGGAARFSFAAKIEGEFVIELERTKRQVAALRVRP
jgi:hypothetical protein